MKIFKDWNNEIPAFVVFLAKESCAQNRRMRKLHNQYYENGDVDVLKQYTTQCGVAMHSHTVYNIAKVHFGLDSFKRKHIIKNNEKESL